MTIRITDGKGETPEKALARGELTAQDYQLISDVLYDHAVNVVDIRPYDSVIQAAALRRRDEIRDLAVKIEKIIQKKFGGQQK